MPGDEFGKSALEDEKSTNLFLGDGSGKPRSAGYGTRISPGFSCSLR
ncbi:MAG: hypothetical protein MUO73_07755 [Thermoplasmata archaeon]|nr:hypothetical protein [Thermoplasmata archaeon]